MTDEQNPLIIVQARTGASRLPDKTVLPFWNGRGVLRLILENLLSEFPAADIVVATTISEKDNRVVDVAKDSGVDVFRGSENDVRSRFIAVARDYGRKYIVRVCADNPFLIPGLIHPLIQEIRTGNYDYVSYCDKSGIPVIRTHWGLFTEACKLSALEDSESQSGEQFWREHVTNYIYTNPDRYKIKLLPMPNEFSGREGYRFTMDSIIDFETLRILYAKMVMSGMKQPFKADDIFRFIDNSEPGITEIMRQEIMKNEK